MASSSSIPEPMDPHDPFTHPPWASSVEILYHPTRMAKAMHRSLSNNHLSHMARDQLRADITHINNRFDEVPDPGDPAQIKSLADGFDRMGGPLHYHRNNKSPRPEVILALITGLSYNHMGSMNADHPGLERLRWLFNMTELPQTLRQLTRFVASGHPQLIQAPRGCAPPELNPDGPEHDKLYLTKEWQFRRLWLRMLHFPSWTVPNQGVNGDEDGQEVTYSTAMPDTLTSAYAISRTLLNVEMQGLTECKSDLRRVLFFSQIEE